MRLVWKIPKIWKDVLITTVGAIGVFTVFRLAGELRKLRSGPAIQVGSHFSIPGQSTPGDHRDLIIIGSDSCRYSRSSIEFDRSLLRTAASFGVQVHIIVPTSAAAVWYSSQLLVPSSMLVVHSLAALGVKGTPTVILRDETGVVQGMWEGLLPPNAERAVLIRIGNRKHILESPHFEEIISFKVANEKNDGSASSIPSRPVPVSSTEIDENDLHAIGKDHTVIDLRERNSLSRSEIENEVNIPFPELDVRARIELNPEIPAIVDCSSVDASMCDLAAFKLVSLKFVTVSVLDRGARGMACRISPVRGS
jgi:rhodanese-related sulfurtransferase